MTYYELLLELKEFTTVSQELLDACKESTDNAPGELVAAWCDGVYDEDMEILVQELEIDLRMYNLLK